MKINRITFLFPTLIEYTEKDTEKSVFVYLDRFKNEVLIPDESSINDVELFKVLAIKYINSQYKHVSPPKVPQEGFKAMNPDSFKEQF